MRAAKLPNPILWLAAVAFLEAGSAAQDPLAEAEALLVRGHYAAAVERLDPLAELPPRGRYLLGFALIQLYRYDEAEAHLRQAVAADPNQPDWHHALARTLLEQGRNQAALAVLERAIGLVDKPEFHYAKAMCALNLGRLELAEEALSAALRLRPDDPQALYQLGRIRADRGDYDAAIQPLTRSIELNPSQADARFLLGLAYRHRGDPGAAADAFAAVVERVPGHAGALYNLGTVLAQTGRADEAAVVRERFTAVSARQDEIEFLKAALRKDPAHLAGRLQLARRLLDGGRIDEALEQLDAARRLKPVEAAIYRELDRAFTLRGDTARARQAARLAAELEAREP